MADRLCVKASGRHSTLHPRAGNFPLSSGRLALERPSLKNPYNVLVTQIASPKPSKMRTPAGRRISFVVNFGRF